MHVTHHNSSVYTTDYEKKFTDSPRIQLFTKKVRYKHVYVYLMVQMSTQNVMMYIELFAEAINRYIIIIILVA